MDESRPPSEQPKREISEAVAALTSAQLIEATEVAKMTFTITDNGLESPSSKYAPPTIGIREKGGKFKIMSVPRPEGPIYSDLNSLMLDNYNARFIEGFDTREELLAEFIPELEKLGYRVIE